MSGHLLRIHVEGPGIDPQTYTFSPERQITIGRAVEADVPIRDRFSGRRHARIDLGWSKCVLRDLSSANGTYVNGRRLDKDARFLEAGDRIRIGTSTIDVLEAPGDEVTAERPTIPLDRVEAELIAAIVGADGASRLVYADWLEGCGKLAHAEFLRLQEELHAAPQVDGWHLRAERLRELAASIDVQWRRKVGRPAIEGCTDATFDLRCPKDWSAGLAATERTGVRRCGACARDVYYALTVGEAREHAARGRCVALDAGVVRWKQDLAPPYGERICYQCDTDLGPAFHAQCPSCGAPQEPRHAIVGLMA